MGAINRKLQQLENEFILLSDLLISLGEHTQDTLRDILIFLKNENIQKIDLYEFKNFQPKKICPPDFPIGTSEILLSELLEQGINTFCIFDYFVFDNSFDFNNLALNPQVFGKVTPKPLGVSDEQEKFLYKLCYQNDLAFKKSDLMQQDWFDEVFLTASDNKVNDQQQIADLQAENASLHAENADLLKRIAELESQLNQARENGTPAFMNHTEEIAIIGAVYDEFWANLAPNEIPPKKDIVLDWIAKNYKISKNIASAIDTICRPPEPRKGGQKTR